MTSLKLKKKNRKNLSLNLNNNHQDSQRAYDGDEWRLRRAERFGRNDGGRDEDDRQADNGDQKENREHDQPAESHAVFSQQSPELGPGRTWRRQPAVVVHRKPPLPL